MPFAKTKKRTNTGLSKIADKSPENRPKTRRLEGEGDFPLIFFFSCRLPNRLPPANDLFSPVVLTARKEPSKRTPYWTSDPIAYQRGCGRNCFDQGFPHHVFCNTLPSSPPPSFALLPLDLQHFAD
jgi:hypothetical protein